MPIADCHIHVFDAGQFPFPPDAAYRPEIGPRDGFLNVALGHDVTHALVVNAFRGVDHRQMISVLKWGGGALRGIATLEPDATDEDMDVLQEAGVVGQRFDLASVEINRLRSTEGRRFLTRLRQRGWLAELQMNAKTSPDLLVQLLPLLQDAELQLVIGHYSQPSPMLPLDQPIFAEIMKLARDGQTVMKLSSFFRHSQRGLPYTDLDPFIGPVLNEFGTTRCVWGSDWPFTRFAGYVTYGEELACIDRWLPDPADRQMVLWGTAARVFGFQESAVLATE